MQKHTNLDSHGIPPLTQTEIDILTRQALQDYAPNCLNHPIKTPVLVVAQGIAQEHNFKINLSQKLNDKVKNNIKGCFDLESNTIFIDEGLNQNSSQFNHILAHQLGHAFLHNKLSNDVLSNSSCGKIIDSDNELNQIHEFTTNLRSQIELQANKFSTSLLLPEPIFTAVLESTQRKIGLSRNIGQVLPVSTEDPDFHKLIHELVLIFETLSPAIKMRLYFLKKL